MKTYTKTLAVGSSLLALLLASCASNSSEPQAGHQMTKIGSVKPYTKNVCLVTGKKLGSMGDPVSIVHNGQEMKFCCKPCIPKFKANPETYLAQL